MIAAVRIGLASMAGVSLLLPLWALVEAPSAASDPTAPTPAVGVSVQSSANPHGDLGIACSDCHATSSWTELRDPLLFDHAEATGFDLAAGHGAVDCAACHQSPVFQFVASACADCHADPHRGEVGFGCETCHSSAGWQDRQQMFIFHFTTLFPLNGAHARVDCDSCHRAAPPFEFASTPTDCADCHTADYLATTEPDHEAVGFPLACDSCHTDANWESALFVDHSFFPLTGGHARVDCDSCHVDGFAGTPTDCYSCHAADYAATTDPDHAEAGFPTECEQCHTIASWDDADFDHDRVFQLVGAHRNAECDSCHVNGVYAGTPRDCYSCHAVEYQQTDDPNHEAAGFPTDCDACHTEQRWEGAVFEHDAFFELNGAHRNTDCASCHVDGVYGGTPRDCYSCHTVEYQETTEPDHEAAGFPIDCETCHTEQRWEGAVFEHDTFFELNGAHRNTDCASCHVDGVYAGTPRDCYSCHTVEYQETTEPDHEAAGFPIDCETCHTEQRWEGAVFEHDSFFRLQGAHRNVDCASCHVDGVYAGTPRDCYSCHTVEYQETTEPNHEAAGFPIDCETCHTQQRWEGAVFEHDSFFQLNGAHRNTDCASCHVDGVYGGTPRDCYSCHTVEYQETTEPDHEAAGFPIDCETCHTEQRWEGAVFEHDSFFQLQGAHRNVDCASCHIDGVYAGTPQDCYSCHTTEYQQTTDPNHAQAGFPTDCEACHNQNDWDDAVFDHDSFFQLQGAHRNVDCASCHIDGVYAGTPQDCYSCHTTEYQQTTDPNHEQAGFPTDCEACHNQNDWDDADFNHDGLYFPIYSGEHRGEWNACSDCHVNPGNYAVFECINCHEHSQAEMADEHNDVNGYQWVSTACLQCHPQGNENDRIGFGRLVQLMQRRFPGLRPLDAWPLSTEEPR